MLLYSPFPYLPTLNPPTTTRCRLRLLSLPPSSLPSAAAASPSPSPSVASNKDFIVDYLVDSLEFSRNEAISASTQVNHFKSSTKPELVINFFQKYGFNKTQIREIVSSSPKILSCKVDKTLEPKIKFIIQNIGLSVSYNAKLIKRNPSLLSSTSLKKLQLNVEMLKSYGIMDEKIRKFIICNPKVISLNPERLEELLNRVDKDLGIDFDSPMFLHGVRTLALLSKETLDKKIDMFKRFGWTDSDIVIMSKHQPWCLCISEDRIFRVLNFLMKELGYTSEYLACRSSILNMSLDKRLKPRYAVLKALRENKLRNAKPVLYSVAFMAESKFLELYVSRYKDRVPNLYEIYENNRKE